MKVLSGDGELVTRKTCEQVGIPVERIVLGSELEQIRTMRSWRWQSRPTGRNLGFGVLPPAFFVTLLLLVGTYLALVQLLMSPLFQVGGWRAQM